MHSSLVPYIPLLPRFRSHSPSSHSASVSLSPCVVACNCSLSGNPPSIYTQRFPWCGRLLLLLCLVVDDEDVDEADDVVDEEDEDEYDEDGAARGAASDSNDLLRRPIPLLNPLPSPSPQSPQSAIPSHLFPIPPLTRPKALPPKGGLFARLCVYATYI
ncbi:hypothetical protein GY45DRAFT_1319471 [Cubamyces sp. BRFM 1775]|nr:hypothetical protein GY45DRAFT_1319471 [Cubamyces sp. BRFM 1775]